MAISVDSAAMLAGSEKIATRSTISVISFSGLDREALAAR
jgi:hypothetical protein